MVGYATDETPSMMPREWVLARDLCLRLHELRVSGELAWLRSDCKTQVSVDAEGRVLSVIIAAEHSESVSISEVREELLLRAVRPAMGDGEPPKRVTINGTGRFTIGGPAGDAGVVGRKIVVDAYGPRVPVGGGAYSGKDPTKVDRSAAYMARHVAKQAVAERVAGARQCTVTLAYGIGQLEPEMVSAVSDTGADLSGWVRSRYPDLSPGFIIDYLNLRRPNGWTYQKTAAYGHFGRDLFPWERLE
jgi:S-adenosylmethionine synthetase